MTESTPTRPYYTDDHVVLYHGDCRTAVEWLTADVLVTDPPYGVAWGSAPMTSYTGGVGFAAGIAGDATPEMRDTALRLWGRRPGVIFGSWRVERPTDVRHRLIWHKQGRKPGVTSAPWYSADEEIYILGDGFTGKPEQTVYRTTEDRSQAPGIEGHPTPKPVGLMERLIAKCPPGVIADPFAGSGATLAAAKNLGRRAIGVEVDEAYCEIAARRLTQDALFGGAA